MEKGLGKNKEDFRGMKRTVVEKEIELKEKTKEAVKWKRLREEVETAEKNSKPVTTFRTFDQRKEWKKLLCYECH